MNLRPFFTYYGGKYRVAKSYPAPKMRTICEPFAGSAGYSLRYPQKNVILIDSYDAIYRTWDYLLSVKESEILALPSQFNHVSEINCPEEAKLLIGWWLNAGSASPCKQPSKWMRSEVKPDSFWGDAIKSRIARQLQYIRHWKIIHSGYSQAEDIPATWFIDPPYQKAGVCYKESSKKIDFNHLGEFCKSRQGQIIVCENEGADWLDFAPFRTIRATPKTSLSQFSGSKDTSKEVIWYRDTDSEPNIFGFI